MNMEAGPAVRGITCGRLIVFALGIMLALSALAAAPGAPDFLPVYFGDALHADGRPLRLVSVVEKDGIDRAEYAGPGGVTRLVVEHMACDRASCDVLYDQSLKNNNAKLTKLKGVFKSVSPVEFAAVWKVGKKQHFVYVAKSPKALTAWTRVGASPRQPDDDAYLKDLREATNRQRYEEAAQIDNVEIGRWAREIHQHARNLMARGKTEEALAVLKQVITWSASSFEAQLDFAEHTPDAAAAQASALAVWENAESPILTARAARLLGRQEASLDAPILEPGLTGLQVVLIPLQPCDTRLLEEAGHLYAASLDVPVRIARLPSEWSWGVPDRLYRQRDMQGLLLRKAGKPMDFSGWLQGHYDQALKAAVEKDDALTHYTVHTFLEDVVGKPGQYRAEVYVDRLIDRLARFRGGDRRTLYVGVTEADIYGGETNFLFSGTTSKNGDWAGILSYARMQTAATGEPFQSRKRLTERLAKEMVPATLKQLGIPRPTDPTDPYSYSDGVQRLEQKTLTLSVPTRKALDQFRTP